MAERTNSRRYLGDQFKRWRIDAGLSREDVGEAVNCAAETIKSVEQGRRPLSPRVARITDEMTGARGKLMAGLNYQSEEDNRFPERSQDFFGYETDALVLCSYEPLLIPGLLQTEAYARALIGERVPVLDEETAEQRVRARLARQKILHRTPAVDLSFVLYEAALRYPACDANQLRHMAKLVSERRISLQVLPFERAVADALDGPMVLLEDKNHDCFTLSEGQEVTQFTHDSETVSELTKRYGKIRQEALSSRESLRFIERLVDER